MGVKMNSGGFRMVGAGKSTLDGGPVSPRKAEAGANVKGGQAKVPKYAAGGSVGAAKMTRYQATEPKAGANSRAGYADGGCVTRTTGSSRVVSGMKNGGRAKK